MAASPNFTVTPRVGAGQVTTASSSYGTGALSNSVLIFTAGANGSRINKVIVQCAATSAAAIVRLFYTIDDSTTNYLFAEIAVAAATGSATVKQDATVTTLNYDLPPATAGKYAKVYATTSVTQNTNVIVLAGDY